MSKDDKEKSQEPVDAKHLPLLTFSYSMPVAGAPALTPYFFLHSGPSCGSCFSVMWPSLAPFKAAARSAFICV